MNVSLLPVACSNLAFILSRSRTTRVTSISKTPCTCALVRLDMSMCSAIFLRMVRHGHEFAGGDSSDGLQWRGDRRELRELRSSELAQLARAAAAGAPPACLAMKASMSSLVMRPPKPVPGTLARSTLFSLAILRTSGLERTRPCSPLSDSPRLRGCGGAGAAAEGFGSSPDGGWAAWVLSSGWSGLCRRRGLGGRGSSGCVAISDDTDYGVDLHGVAGFDLDLLQGAGRGRGDFGVNLVGGDFKQRLVALNFVAGLLEPLGDGSFEDRFPHLGHDDVSRHGFLPQKYG